MTKPNRDRLNSIYTGDRDELGTVHVVADGLLLDWQSTLKLQDHSPTGPEWGYLGTGPAQLALALLVHALRGNTTLALDLYQAYTEQVVSRWTRSHWTTTRAAILLWIREQPRYLTRDVGSADGGQS